MKTIIVKYIAIIFVAAFIINFIGGIGVNIWGLSKIFERNKKDSTSEKSYDEYIAEERLMYYYKPKVDSLINTDPRKAITYVDRLLIEYPNEYYLTLQKGLAYYEIDSLESALKYFEKSIEYNGREYPRALEYIGWTLAEQKKYDQAILKLKKAAKTNDSYNLDIAQLYELKEDKLIALQYYKKVLKSWEDSNMKFQWWKKIAELKEKIAELEKTQK